MGMSWKKVEEEEEKESLCTWEKLAEVDITILKEVETTNRGKLPKYMTLLKKNKEETEKRSS